MKDFSIIESELSPSQEQLRDTSLQLSISHTPCSHFQQTQLVSSPELVLTPSDTIPTPFFSREILITIPTPFPPSPSPSKDEENSEVPKSPYSSPCSGQQEKLSNVEKRPCDFDWSEEMKNCLGDENSNDFNDFDFDFNEEEETFVVPKDKNNDDDEVPKYEIPEYVTSEESKAHRSRPIKLN